MNLFQIWQVLLLHRHNCVIQTLLSSFFLFAVSTHVIVFVLPLMWAGTCAGSSVSACVCQCSSLNIVLCSSNSSSSRSAVAACSTVYFPSWRTTSYQISIRGLLACCPTTRSQRISHPLFSRQSWCGACLWGQQKEPLTHLSVMRMVTAAWMSVDLARGA